MSFLLGPFDKNERSDKQQEDEELLVFGYSCKLYRDDVRAILEDSGQLLIPWMGDNSLMVDRYDIRNRLDDKSQFGLKPNLPRRMTREEEELEDELDKERYLALEWDEIRVEEQEEEEKKRNAESSYTAVGFSYDSNKPSSTKSEEPGVLVCNPQRLEHPPTHSVDHGEDDMYTVPMGLVLPEDMQTPATNKIHSIIERTASFVSQQGTQMEIIIKAKQKFNPFFSFLDYKDDLHPYYRHIKELITNGAYTVRQQSPDVAENQDVPVKSPLVNGSEETANKTVEEEEASGVGCDEKESRVEAAEGVEEEPAVTVKIVGPDHEKDSESGGSESEDSESDDEGGGYLHPLLMRAMNSKSRTPTPSRESSPLPRSSVTTSSESTQSHSTATTSAFYTKSYSINSAPSLEPVVEESKYYTPLSQSHDTKTQPPYPGSRPPPAGPPGQQQGYETMPYHSGANSYYHNAQHIYQQQQQQQQHPLQSHMYAQSHYHQHHTTPPPNGPYDYQAYYQMMSANHIHQLQNEPPVPPPDLKSVVDKTAEYVAKNGETFERTVLERHAGDSRFNFINPWDKYHSYYKMVKQHYRNSLALPEGAPISSTHVMDPSSGSSNRDNEGDRDRTLNVQDLSERDVVSFKLKSKAPTPVMVDSNVNVFGVDEAEEENLMGEEGAMNDDPQEREGHLIHEEPDLMEEEEPPPKKRCTKKDKIGNKVQEFLSTVKAMFDDEDS